MSTEEWDGTAEELEGLMSEIDFLNERIATLQSRLDHLVTISEDILRAGMRLNRWNRERLKNALAQAKEES